MEIRQAIGSDARQIAEVHVDSWRAAYQGHMPASLLASLSVDRLERFWQEQLTGTSRRTLIAVDKQEIVGWLAFGHCRDADGQADDWEVYGVYVATNWWRRGVGSQLWSSAVEAIRQSGAVRVAVWVLETNQGARRFYESFGGKADGARKQVDHEGVELPAVRYWCPLETFTRRG